jgi:spore germination cell wall hydrolase CwlJ-like protein
MEKPNSIFKKKEAVEICQAVGQFAQAAPGTTLRIMLKVLSNAFTDVNIKPEDWAALDAEIKANLARGVSDGSSPGGGSAPQQGGGGDLRAQAQNLPPQIKQKIVQMKNSGASPDQLKAAILQAVQQQSNSGQQQQQVPGSGQQRSIANGAPQQ